MARRTGWGTATRSIDPPGVPKATRADVDVSAAGTYRDPGTLTPTDIPTPALEKLSRTGPNNALRRHVHPTGNLAFGAVFRCQASCIYECTDRRKLLVYPAGSSIGRGSQSAGPMSGNHKCREVGWSEEVAMSGDEIVWTALRQLAANFRSGRIVTRDRYGARSGGPPGPIFSRIPLVLCSR